jgi:hypothetical protein
MREANPKFRISSHDISTEIEVKGGNEVPQAK